MKILSADECSAWLDAQRVEEDPYGKDTAAAPFVEQIPLPAEPLRRSALARSVLGQLRPYSNALLQYVWWSLYKPDEMVTIRSIRAAHGELRPLPEAPGHQMPMSEHDLLVGLLSLSMFYCWSAYVYFADGTTLLCWKGEMLDFWTFDEARMSQFRALAGEFNLRLASQSS
jgi:hypothetical protein